MKLTPSQIETFLTRPNKNIVGCLIYGPNQGLVQERSKSITKSFLSETYSFQSTATTMSDLKTNPSILQDELRTIPFGGGRRFIWVQDANDNLTKILKPVFEEKCWDGFVLVSTSELGPRSSLRQLCENHKHAVSIACYDDQPQDITNIIQSMVKIANKTITPDALRWLQNYLGNDRLLTRQELDKLLLYKGNTGSTINLEDVQAIISDAKQLGIDMLCHALADRNLTEAIPIYQDLIAHSEQPITITRALQRYFGRLFQVKALIQQGQSIEKALQSLQPPLFFRDKPKFIKQLQLWTVKDITRFLRICQTTEWACKQTGSLPEATLGQSLIHTLIPSPEIK